jgi:hypothetical protein
MLAYYQGERRGQSLTLVVFVGTLGVAVTAIVLKSEAIGVAAILSAGGSLSLDELAENPKQQTFVIPGNTAASKTPGQSVARHAGRSTRSTR